MVRQVRSMGASKRNNGFTLAELLIVVAIIGVLVAIAVPVFGAQRERANIAVDQATMRNAYAQFVSEQLSGNVESGKEYFYNAAAQTFVPKNSVTKITGYGKAKTDVSTWWTGVGTASGIPNNGIGLALVLTMETDGSVNLHWGNDTYAGMKVTESSEYKELSHAEKVARDKLLLDSLQNVAQGMTYGQLYDLFYDGSGELREAFQGNSKTGGSNQPLVQTIKSGGRDILYITIAESTIENTGEIAAGGEKRNQVLADSLFTAAGYNVSDTSAENYLITSVSGKANARIWLCLGMTKEELQSNRDHAADKAYTYIKGAGAITDPSISMSTRKIN